MQEGQTQWVPPSCSCPESIPTLGRSCLWEKYRVPVRISQQTAATACYLAAILCIATPNPFQLPLRNSFRLEGPSSPTQSPSPLVPPQVRQATTHTALP